MSLRCPYRPRPTWRKNQKPRPRFLRDPGFLRKTFATKKLKNAQDIAGLVICGTPQGTSCFLRLLCMFICALVRGFFGGAACLPKALNFKLHFSRYAPENLPKARPKAAPPPPPPPPHAPRLHCLPVEHVRREAQGGTQLHRTGTHHASLHQRRIGVHPPERLKPRRRQRWLSSERIRRLCLPPRVDRPPGVAALGGAWRRGQQCRYMHRGSLYCLARSLLAFCSTPKRGGGRRCSTPPRRGGGTRFRFELEEVTQHLSRPIFNLGRSCTAVSIFLKQQQAAGGS